MSDIALTASLQRLVDELKKLPGIGPRSAERVAFHLLKATRDEALALAQAITDTKNDIRPCTRCFNLAEGGLCAICANPRRDHTQIVVVEQPKDLIKLEATGIVTGVYHVLMGHIAPLDGVEPDDLTIQALVRRVKIGQSATETVSASASAPDAPDPAAADAPPRVCEIILATSPTLEGDATALHITSLLRGTDIKITRLARGIAPGSPLEYANRSMLEEALRGRHEY